MRQWRLIYDQPAFGAWNMAVDEALLNNIASGDQRPVLRLYSWKPFCLSLGYGQRSRDLDEDRLYQRGWHAVRRPTGGRAILHGDELTYSLTLPVQHKLAQGDVISSYKRISRALLHTLETLSVASQSEKQAKGNSASIGPVCFEIPSHYEITASGRKLIGSAQLRRSTGILQHGSLPLYGDISRICDVLAYPTEAERSIARQSVQQRATTLQQAAGNEIALSAAANAFIQGFSETFGIELLPDGLNPEEYDTAETLLHEKYSQPSWTHKRK